MTRTDIINYYLKQQSPPTNYLEIGINKGANFNLIKADNKDGVDPSELTNCNYHMTSDDFFKINTNKYNVIFIDGLHFYEQVYKDINNSLDAIKKEGVIVLHDCNPVDEWHQRETNIKGTWNGTVWKAFVRLRCERSDLEMFVIDADYGVGIIRPDKQQKTFEHPEIINDYNLFEKHKKMALNLISVKEWKDKLYA